MDDFLAINKIEGSYAVLGNLANINKGFPSSYAFLDLIKNRVTAASDDLKRSYPGTSETTLRSPLFEGNVAQNAANGNSSQPADLRRIARQLKDRGNIDGCLRSCRQSLPYTKLPRS